VELESGTHSDSEVGCTFGLQTSVGMEAADEWQPFHLKTRRISGQAEGRDSPGVT